MSPVIAGLIYVLVFGLQEGSTYSWGTIRGPVTVWGVIGVQTYDEGVRFTEKDLEILVLHQQVRMLEHQLDRPVHPSRIEKLTLAVVTAKLKTVSRRSATGLRDMMLLFQPETVLKWHRELVRRKWTYRTTTKPRGRPRTAQEVEALVVRLAQENADWGFGKIAGELGKLGVEIINAN